MKQYFIGILMLAFLTGGQKAQAQVDLMDALKQTAEMHNEQNASNDASGGNTPPGSPANNSSSEEESAYEYIQNIIDEEHSEEFYHLDKPMDYCLAMMVLFIYHLRELEDQTESELNCKMKYDLYGMQLLMLTGSTTIMYCPEELSELNGNEKIIAMDGFLDLFLESTVGGADHYTWTEFAGKMQRFSLKLYSVIIRRHGYDPDGYMRYAQSERLNALNRLLGFFDPKYVVPRIMDIGQKMEALGCGG